MPITRTSMIDDDGSGLTGTVINNAWKQEFYNQIDDLIGAVGFPWTPTDASGAGLIFGIAQGRYSLVGPMVMVWGRVTYPTTANGSNALISGLPYLNGDMFAGFYQTFGVSTLFHLAPGAVSISLLNPATGAQHTNAALSGVQLIFQGSYLYTV